MPEVRAYNLTGADSARTQNHDLYTTPRNGYAGKATAVGGSGCSYECCVGDHTMSTTENLQQTIAHIQVVSQQFLAGDPAPFQACWSHAADVTLCGAWGAYEKGWEQVGPRLEWAAARYRGGHTNFELLALTESD